MKSPGCAPCDVVGRCIDDLQSSVLLNRKDFGIDINMPLETDGVVLGDKVNVTLDIEALKNA
jgi:hypothetical protein